MRISTAVWTPIPPSRGSKLGSDALSMMIAGFMQRPQQSGWQKVEVGAAVHLAFHELELGDLSLNLTIGPRLGANSGHAFGNKVLRDER